jgi:hypothetical protein
MRRPFKRINLKRQDRIRVVTPEALALEVKNASARQRAVLAADMADGWLIVTPLPPRVANQLAGAIMHIAKAARSLHPSERTAVWQGELDLPFWRNKVKTGMAEIRTNRVLTALGLPELVSVSED